MTMLICVGGYYYSGIDINAGKYKFYQNIYILDKIFVSKENLHNQIDLEFEREGKS